MCNSTDLATQLPSQLNEPRNSITIYANSLGCATHSLHRFGSAPFSTETREDAELICSLPDPNQWLYYPDELGKELLKNSLNTIIYAHSGLIYIDGERQIVG